MPSKLFIVYRGIFFLINFLRVTLGFCLLLGIMSVSNEITEVNAYDEKEKDSDRLYQHFDCYRSVKYSLVNMYK